MYKFGVPYIPTVCKSCKTKFHGSKGVKYCPKCRICWRCDRERKIFSLSCCRPCYKYLIKVVDDDSQIVKSVERYCEWCKKEILLCCMINYVVGEI